MKTFTAILGMALAFCYLTFGGSLQADQLYGKVYTVDDEIIEGFIRWDKNEASWDDILDGNKRLDREKRSVRRGRRDYDRGREVKIFGLTVYSEDNGYFNNWVNEAQSGIRMGHIQTLIPVGDDEVELKLKSGEDVELKGGSGDIGTDNREILIDDPNEGIVEMYWDDIDRIDFINPPKKESRFGKRLYGTVTIRRGDEYTGFICWDMDEAFDTDILDGREKNRKRKIEFGKIKSIERRSSASAIVTLKSGKSMRLDDSNDIDSGNRGIVISDPNLGRIIVDWSEFEMATFTDPPEGPRYDNFDGGRRLYGTVYTEDGNKFEGEIKWDDDEEFTWEILDGDYHNVKFDIEFSFIESIEKSSHRSSTVTLKDGRSFKLRSSNDIDNDNKGIFIFNKDDEIMVDWSDFERVEFSTK